MSDHVRYKHSGPQGDLQNRNPFYPDGSLWREFLYDVRHPGKAWNRFKIGARLGIDWLVKR